MGYDNIHSVYQTHLSQEEETGEEERALMREPEVVKMVIFVDDPVPTPRRLCDRLEPDPSLLRQTSSEIPQDGGSSESSTGAWEWLQATRRRDAATALGGAV
jgi:hypothetical protein